MSDAKVDTRRLVGRLLLVTVLMLPSASPWCRSMT